MPLFVTVTPGTTVTNSTTLDATTLNLLGTPSVDVTGTVDGGSLSISPGSVGTAQLADNAVTFAKLDNIDGDRLIGRDDAGSGDPTQISVGGGLQFTGGNSIEIGNGLVTYAKIQNVAASKLLGNPTGSPALASEITLGTGLSFAGTTLNAATYTKYSSPSGLAIPAAGGEIAGFNHSLGGYPSQFRVFAQCVNASSTSGYPLGYRVPIEVFQGDFDVPAFVAWASSSQLGLRRTNLTSLQLNNYNTGARSVYPAADWQLYFEAVRFT